MKDLKVATNSDETYDGSEGASPIEQLSNGAKIVAKMIDDIFINGYQEDYDSEIIFDYRDQNFAPGETTNIYVSLTNDHALPNKQILEIHSEYHVFFNQNFTVRIFYKCI